MSVTVNTPANIGDPTPIHQSVGLDPTGQLNIMVAGVNSDQAIAAQGKASQRAPIVALPITDTPPSVHAG